jgi:hypothetical protein
LAPLNRLDLQSLDPFKVLAVVGEYGQAVVQAGGGDQEIKVADESPLLAQPAAFPAENLAHLFSVE